MALLRKVMWLTGFAVCTFFFVVLFEYVAHDMRSFAGGAKQEFRQLVRFLGDLVTRDRTSSEQGLD